MGVSSAFGFLHALATLWTYGRGITEEKQLVSEDATALLTEEEMQRRQLLVLLDQGWNEGGKSPTPRTMHKTFEVDSPARLKMGSNDWKHTPSRS